MKIEIKHRWNGSILFAGEFGSLRLAVEAAIAQKADLRAADLSAANLSAANLRAANLRAADLSAANLRAADLSAADLSAANLSDADLSAADLSAANLSAADLSAADLSAANLSDANLRDADLSAANLRDADLRAADLSAANLSDADLSAADLSAAKEDFLRVLDSAPNEVAALRQAHMEGRIDGTCYEGDCCCLKGTLEKAGSPRLPHAALSPAEMFYYPIRPGYVPSEHDNAPWQSRLSAIAVGWIDEWLAARAEQPNPAEA